MRMVAINGDKVRKMITGMGDNLITVDDKLGVSKGYMSKACIKNSIPEVICNQLAVVLGCEVDDLLKKDNEPETVEQPSGANVDMSGVIEAINALNDKMDDILDVFGKIANLTVQNMEYSKSIMDSADSCNTYLKALNEKWNKPSAYKGTYKRPYPTTTTKN